MLSLILLSLMDIDDDDDEYPEYDDSFLSERRQRSSTLGGVDWRYEKGGVFYDD